MAIRNLCDQQKSDLLLIAELMNPYDNFLVECIKQIKLNIFTFIFKHNHN